ncbi:hypothetical protein [Kribbella sp. NPDC004875]
MVRLSLIEPGRGGAERTAQRVCEGLALAMPTYGVPEEIVNNGKGFTGR